MKKEMTFEAAGTELDAILAELSDSETPLDRQGGRTHRLLQRNTAKGADHH